MEQPVKFAISRLMYAVDPRSLRLMVPREQDRPGALQGAARNDARRIPGHTRQLRRLVEVLIHLVSQADYSPPIETTVIREWRVLRPVSYCVTGICPHGRGVFIWLPGGAPYLWVHSTTAPGAGGRLEVCGLMPPATAVEAGEACRDCGHGTGPDGHLWPEGRFTGEYPSPGACRCGCAAWMQPGPPRGALARMVASDEETEQRHRLSAGEAVPGGPGACTRDGCGHLTLWHGDAIRGYLHKGQPCRKCRCPGWTDEPGAVMPPRAPEQGSLFDLEVA